MSEDEATDVSLNISPPETQFIPQEGDEEVLWKVIEITAEKKKYYKVRWEGTDPATNKPWAQSWVTKHDCTDDLVAEWKISKARSKREAQRKKSKKQEQRKGRASVVSRTSVATNGSNALAGSSSNSTHPTTTIPDHDSPPVTNHPSRTTTSSKLHSVEIKRKRSESTSDNELPAAADLVRQVTADPKRKKRKVDNKEEEASDQARVVYQTQRHGKLLLQFEEEEEGSDEDGYSSPPKAKPRVTAAKRRILLSADGRRTKFPAEDKAPSSRKTIAMKAATKRDIKKASIPAKSATKRKQVLPETDFSSEQEEQTKSKVRYAVPDSKGMNVVEMPRLPPIRRSPVLTPRAKTRLAQFDALVLGLLDQPVHRQSDDPPYYDFDQREETAAKVPNKTRKVNDVLLKVPLSRSSSEHSAPSSKVAGNRRKPNGGMPSLLKSPVGDDSYLIGVVPETEPESSSYNTQSQSQPAPNSHRHSEPSSLLPPRTPPTTSSRNVNAPSPRSTLISRMKPKTPSSSNLSPTRPLLVEPLSPLQLKDSHMNANPKPLRPLLVISPSTFLPHLSSSDPPMPSDPAASGSRIESLCEHDAQEYTLSPIENFSSPEKQGKVKKRKGKLILSSMSSSSSSSSSSSLSNTSLRKRQTRTTSVGIIESADSDPIVLGQQLAEHAQQQKLRERAVEMGSVKGSLTEPLQPQNELGMVLEGKVTEEIVRGSVSKPTAGEDAQEVGVEVEVGFGFGFGVAIDDGPDATTMTEDASILQEMEDAYVDLNGEGGSKDLGVGQAQGRAEGEDIPAYIRYRKEEEESTQDILNGIRGGVEKESELGRDVDDAVAGDGNGDVVDTSLDIEMASADTRMEIEEQSKGPEVVVEAPAVPFGSEVNNPGEQQDNGEGASRTGWGLDEPGTRSKSESPGQARNAEDETVADPIVLTPEGIPEQPQFPSAPVNDVEGVANIETGRISTLEGPVGGERTTGDSLAEEVKNLREALALASVPNPIIAELQQQLTALRETLAANTVAWDAERIALTTTVESQTRAKASAEEDRDFFREQYAQASGYVTSVREENQALELRAQIAEKRAVEGVALVRATFSERMKMLEGEVLKHKRTAELVIAVDRRTGQDIRRRAGEEPRLRARCAELEQRVEVLEYEKEALEMDLAELEQEKENWLSEAEVSTQLRVVEGGERGGEEEEGEGPFGDTTAGKSEDDGDQMMHRCQWRTDGTGACNWFSSDIEQLESHLYLAGHLQEALS